MAAIQIGIDTGGTFTDALAAGRDGTAVLKTPSTPADPAAAVIDIIGRTAVWGGSALEVVHGTTVGTNALLEGKGGPAVLIVTEGFTDLLEIGRQDRLRIYDLLPSKVAFPAPAAPALAAAERTLASGEILRRIAGREVQRLARQAVESRAESVAVCLLHSYADPSNEIALGEALRRAGLFVSLSHQVVGEFREFERCSTTYVNAYLAPVIGKYLEKLALGLAGAAFGIMQSSGGTASASRISQMPVRTLLSGPAAGVVGAARVAADSGWPRALTLDMGGTSADVSIIDGEITRIPSLNVAGLPIVGASVMIETVGAGGGSLAGLDPGGALAVGPESAGADPGPACYGKSDLATVTDANVVLGRIPGDGLLGGEFPIRPAAARAAVGRLARRMGVGVEEAAEGVVSVVNATMERAVRAVSVQRGHDPSDFALVAFGGAGGLHACEVASALGIPAVLVPPAAGVLSAYGLLCADAVEEKSRTVLLKPGDRRPLSEALAGLAVEVRDLLRGDEGVLGRVRLEKMADLRYVGQSHEITVPWGRDLARAFHAAHERLYGHAEPEAEAEVVNVRVRGVRERPDAPPIAAGGGEHRRPRASTIWWGGRKARAMIYDRVSLRSRERVSGPCLVCEYSATSFVPPGWGATVDANLNLVLRPTR